MTESNAPVSPPPPEKRKRSHRLRRVLLSLALLLCLLIAFAPAIVVRIANRTLPGALGTDAHVGGLSFNLLRGSATVRDFTISQPDGFSGDPLLSVSRISVHVPPRHAVSQDPVLVKRLRIEDLHLSIMKDTNGVLNVSKLGGPKDTNVVEQVEKDQPTSQPPPLLVEEAQVDRFQFRFSDAGKDFVVTMTNLQMRVENFAVGLFDDAPPYSSVQLSFGLQGVQTSAQFQLDLRMSPVRTDTNQIPAMQMVMALTGFELDIVKPFVPSAVRAVLGGDALDLLWRMEIGAGTNASERILRGEYQIVSDKGERHADKIGGTLAKPEIPIMGLVWDAVLSRPGSMVGGLFRRAVAGTGAAIGTVLDTGSEAVVGTAKTVKSMGSGLFTTVKGVVTLDGETITTGLTEATVGSVSNLAGTVVGTVTAAGTGVIGTAGELLGPKDTRVWYATTRERAEAIQEANRAWMAERSFPPRNAAKPAKPTATNVDLDRPIR